MRLAGRSTRLRAVSSRRWPSSGIRPCAKDGHARVTTAAPRDVPPLLRIGTRRASSPTPTRFLPATEGPPTARTKLRKNRPVACTCETLRPTIHSTNMHDVVYRAVQWAVICDRPSQNLEMASMGCIGTCDLVPWASVRSRPLHHLEVSFECSSSHCECIPLTSLRTQPLQRFKTALFSCISASAVIASESPVPHPL